VSFPTDNHSAAGDRTYCHDPILEWRWLGPGRNTLSTDSRPLVDDLGDDWVTLAEAAQILELSERTVRRKLKSGEIGGELVYDPDIGTDRWMVHLENLPARAATSGVLVPIEAIDRLELAWAQTREAAVRAQIAERIAEFERERRKELERERDRLRSLLEAESALSERVTELEKRRRIEAERERDRLRAILERDEPEPSRRETATSRVERAPTRTRCSFLASRSADAHGNPFCERHTCMVLSCVPFTERVGRQVSSGVDSFQVDGFSPVGPFAPWRRRHQLGRSRHRLRFDRSAT
jgi:hypothetical protein